MKRILLLALATMLLVSCNTNGPSFRGKVEVVDASSVSVSYSRFDGEKKYTAVIPEASSMKVNVETRKGTLKMVVKGDTKGEVYSGRIDTNFDFSLNLSPDTYTITLQGEKHDGSVTVKW